MRELLALLIPACALGIFIVPRPLRVSRSSVAAAAFAVCLGIGFSSLTSTSLIAVGIGPAMRQFVVADLAMWAGVFTLGLWIRRRRGYEENAAEGEQVRATPID